MYEWMYQLLSFTMLIVRYCANSVLFFTFTKSFFKERYGGRATALIWHTVYIASEVIFYLVFNTVNVFENILNVALDVAILLLLQRLLFSNSGAVSLFTVFSFLAGKQLAASFISVFAYQVLYGIITNCLISMSERSAELFIEYGEIIFFISFAFITMAAIAVYIAILTVYLKIIKKNFRKKDYRLQLKENIFLILPSVASVCISITVRMMEFSEDGGNIFEDIPAAILFIPLVDILLLGTNIASVILFQSLVEYSEEKNKRNLLENQISQMQSEIKEIQDIYSDIRGLRHDMKNHINDISLYVKSLLGRDDPIVEGYIGKMTETVDKLDFSFNTGNPITDIIIHQKGQEAEKKQISFRSDFAFPQKSDIDAYDMGIILNNALENAIEACEKVRSPYIFLRSYSKGGLFFIETENDFIGDIRLDAESGLPATNKENKAAHGLGLVNIQRCAKKYMGDIDIGVNKSEEKSRFTLTVMLKNDVHA